MGWGLFDWVIENTLALIGPDKPYLMGFLFLVLVLGLVAMLRVSGLIAFLFVGALFMIMALPISLGGWGMLPPEVILLVVFVMAGSVVLSWKRFRQG